MTGGVAGGCGGASTRRQFTVRSGKGGAVLRLGVGLSSGMAVLRP
jgi:hypothetical protein